MRPSPSKLFTMEVHAPHRSSCQAIENRIVDPHAVWRGFL